LPLHGAAYSVDEQGNEIKEMAERNLCIKFPGLVFCVLRMAIMSAADELFFCLSQIFILLVMAAYAMKVDITGLQGG
jgi:hypothetical protein